MLTKKEKGDIGLSAALFVATEQGWHCSLPISEHLSYDFIAEKDGKCKRVQARYTTPNKDVLKVKLKSTWADKNGSHARNRKNGDFDVLAVYNPKAKTVYFVDDEEFDNGNSLSLRLKPPINNQKTKVRLARDFVELKACS